MDTTTAPHKKPPTRRIKKSKRRISTTLEAVGLPSNHTVARGRGRRPQLDAMTQEQRLAEAQVRRKRAARSAKECRARKAEYIRNLEARIGELEATGQRLTASLHELRNMQEEEPLTASLQEEEPLALPSEWQGLACYLPKLHTSVLSHGPPLNSAPPLAAHPLALPSPEPSEWQDLASYLPKLHASVLGHGPDAVLDLNSVPLLDDVAREAEPDWSQIMPEDFPSGTEALLASLAQAAETAAAYTATQDENDPVMPQMVELPSLNSL